MKRTELVALLALALTAWTAASLDSSSANLYHTGSSSYITPDDLPNQFHEGIDTMGATSQYYDITKTARELGSSGWVRGLKSKTAKSSKSSKSERGEVHYQKTRPGPDMNPNFNEDSSPNQSPSESTNKPTYKKFASNDESPCEEEDSTNNPPYGNDPAWCHLHSACKLEGHTGLCCPTPDGEYKSCCDIPCDDTKQPTSAPTTTPATSNPTERPVTSTPTTSPTALPTTTPATNSPTERPITSTPTASPTALPTNEPTTAIPTSSPTTATPTAVPSLSVSPSEAPSEAPTSFQQALFEIASQISNPNDILTTGTPANLAFNWILNVDSRENAASDEQELINRYTMALFYYASNGDNWNQCTPLESESGCPPGETRFLDPSSACNWFGVTCGVDGAPVDEIVFIEFADNNLGGGPIPTELGTLSELTRLRLDTGSYDGPIPVELFDLDNLEVLGLADNSLTGQIPPEIAQVTTLEVLSLDGNQLAGDLPTFLSELTNLEILAVGSNGIAGTIPTEYAGLTALEAFGIHENAISGPLPTFLGDLSQLTILSLFLNGLTGPIPSELGQLLQLEELLLHFNGFSGPMPPEICALRTIGALEVLTADCGGANATVQCAQPSCCTVCF